MINSEHAIQAEGIAEHYSTLQHVSDDNVVGDVRFWPQRRVELVSWDWGGK